jgi:hypothetical protein
MPLMKAPDLEEWIVNSHMVCDNSESGRADKCDMTHATHLFMDGWRTGAMIVPKELENIFLEKFAESFGPMTGASASKNRHFIIERRTPIFRMCQDLDFHRDYELDDKLILEYLTFEQQIIAELFPEHKKTPEKFMLIICRTEVKLINKETNESALFKKMTGVRVLFPNLYVDQKTALMIRRILCDKFCFRYGDMHEVQNDWEDVFDQSIYVENGVRMIGSRKSAKCPSCKRQKEVKQRCKECNGNGKVDLGRLYRPWKILIDGKIRDDLLKKLLSQTYQCFKTCSIRCLDESKLTKGFTPPANLIGIDVQRLTSKKRIVVPEPKLTTEQKRKQKLEEKERKQEGTLHQYQLATILSKGINDEDDLVEAGDSHLLEEKPNVFYTSRFEEDEKGERELAQRKLVDIDKSHATIWEGIQKLLRSFQGRSQFVNICVRNIKRSFNMSNYFVQTRGEGSNYCMNVGRNHNSASNWFSLSKKGIVQRCHCSCKSKSPDKGPCKDYKSPPQIIPADLYDLLFTNSVFLNDNFSLSTNAKSLWATRAVAFYKLYEKRVRDYTNDKKMNKDYIAKGKYKENEDSREPIKKKGRGSGSTQAAQMNGDRKVKQETRVITWD